MSIGDPEYMVALSEAYILAERRLVSEGRSITDAHREDYVNEIMTQRGYQAPHLVLSDSSRKRIEGGTPEWSKALDEAYAKTQRRLLAEGLSPEDPVRDLYLSEEMVKLGCEPLKLDEAAIDRAVLERRANDGEPWAKKVIELKRRMDALEQKLAEDDAKGKTLLEKAIYHRMHEDPSLNYIDAFNLVCAEQPRLAELYLQGS